VTAYVPEGWNSISSPNLVREGNVLHGNFTGLPADILTVAVQAPVGPELGQAVFLYAIFIVVTVVVGGLMCWTAGRSLGRILSRKVDALACRTYKVALGIIIWSILTTFLWEVFIITAWTISFNGILRSQAGQESPYFHEQLGPAHCGMALIVLAVLPIGLLITMRSAFGSLRRTH